MRVYTACLAFLVFSATTAAKQHKHRREKKRKNEKEERKSDDDGRAFMLLPYGMTVRSILPSRCRIMPSPGQPLCLEFEKVLASDAVLAAPMRSMNKRLSTATSSGWSASRASRFRSTLGSAKSVARSERAAVRSFESPARAAGLARCRID